jgi:hypothetical protein
MDLVDFFKMKMEHIRINSKVAENVMGWHKNEDEFWYDENDQAISYCQLWNPVENFDYVFRVEEKIKEMRLEDSYVDYLEYITSEGLDDFKHSPQFALLHATAEQRCNAALKSVEKIKCDKTFECCRRLGNEKRFGAFAPLNDFDKSRCQFKFGSNECGYKLEGKR